MRRSGDDGSVLHPHIIPSDHHTHQAEEAGRHEPQPECTFADEAGVAPPKYQKKNPRIEEHTYIHLLYVVTTSYTHIHRGGDTNSIDGIGCIDDTPTHTIYTTLLWGWCRDRDREGTKPKDTGFAHPPNDDGVSLSLSHSVQSHHKWSIPKRTRIPNHHHQYLWNGNGVCVWKCMIGVTTLCVEADTPRHIYSLCVCLCI